MRISGRILVCAALLAPFAWLACSDDDSAVTPLGSNAGDGAAPAPTTTGTSVPDSGGGDSSTPSDGGIQRGPVTLDFDPSGNGDPISAVWDDAKKTLFIADNRNNQIWSWTDADGFKKVATVLDDPAADDAGRTNLGQIVELDDGTLVVPRFGMGTVGAILYVDPTTGKSTAVPNIAANRKRTALAKSPDGKLWGGYFFQPGDGKGVVTRIELDTGEVDYAVGFEKPVATLVVDGKLLVSEQSKSGGIIYSLPLDGTFEEGEPYDVFAMVPSTDALTEGPNGSVFTGQFKPLADGGAIQIRQAFPDGGVRELFADAQLAKAQCVAYDKTNKRLFVCDSNGSTVRTMRIFPID